MHSKCVLPISKKANRWFYAWILRYDLLGPCSTPKTSFPACQNQEIFFLRKNLSFCFFWKIRLWDGGPEFIHETNGWHQSVAEPLEGKVLPGDSPHPATTLMYVPISPQRHLSLWSGSRPTLWVPPRTVPYPCHALHLPLIYRQILVRINLIRQKWGNIEKVVKTK